MSLRDTINYEKRESCNTLESRGKLSFRASEARPVIQSRLERDSKNSGFRRLPRTRSGVRRNEGVSEFYKGLKKKLFGAEHAEIAESNQSKEKM
jgi:hypothetical protein